jgi:WD40 repeat protein
MPTLLTDHPDLPRLTAYRLGQLPEVQLAEVDCHLRLCPECLDLIDAAHPDAFILTLREASRCSSLAQTTGYRDPDSGFDLIPELAGHPRYQVLRLLGQGGMGAVYLARHTLMGRLVALKTINPRFLRNCEAIARFRQEVRAAQLSHPNIVASYDADQVGEMHFLVMEYVEGVSLAEYVLKHGPLQVPEACAYARQAAAGLDHAHRLGMVHRDVKPHNLMRTAAGVVKVLDFGLARLAFDSTPAESGLETLRLDLGDCPASLTATGVVLGTIDFVAPEQASNARAVDSRADIYSLGCTLYYLLTGRVPLPGAHAADKLDLLLAGTLQPLSALRPDLPEGLVRVVARMMAHAPEDRFQTAQEASAALAPFAQLVRKRRMRVLVGFLALSALGLLLAVALALVRVQDPHNREIVTQTDELFQEQPAREMDPEPEKVPVPGKVWLDGFFDAVWSGSFAPDGQTILTTGGPNLLRDRRTGYPIRNIGHAGWFLAYSADGRSVLGSDRTGTRVFLWETETGKLLRSFGNGSGRALDGAVGPDGRTVAATQWNRVHVWDAVTGKQLAAIPVHTECRRPLAYSPDGRRLFVLDANGKTVRGYDPFTGQADGGVLVSDEPLTGLVLSPDGRILVTPSRASATVFLWATPARQDGTGKPFRTLRTGSKKGETWHRYVAFSADGRRLLFGSMEGTLVLYDTDRWAVRGSWENQGSIVSVALSPDGGQALCGCFTDVKRAFLLTLDHPPTASPPATVLTGHDSARAIALSPDGRTGYSSGYDNVVRVWDLAGRKQVRTLAAGTLPFDSLALSPDGASLLVSHRDRTVRLWDTATGQERLVLRGHTDTPACVAISSDGKRAVSGGHDKVLCVWDLQTGRALHTLSGHVGLVRAVAFLPDGRNILSGGHDRTLILWDAETGKLVKRFDPLPWMVLSLAVSRDGRRVVVNTGPEGVTLFEINSGKPIRAFAGHTDMVHAVALSADGNRLLSTGFDHTARVWEVETGRCLAICRGHSDTIVSGVFRGNRSVVTASQDGTLRIWELPE